MARQNTIRRHRDGGACVVGDAVGHIEHEFLVHRDSALKHKAITIVPCQGYRRFRR